MGPQRAAAEGCRSAPIPWTDARATVLTAYGAFSPKMADIADRFFEKRWIDAAGAAGQAAGRLCASDRAVGASLCAAQFQGKPRDVMTLAHELGHGVHQVLAAPKAR